MRTDLGKTVCNAGMIIPSLIATRESDPLASNSAPRGGSRRVLRFEPIKPTN